MRRFLLVLAVLLAGCAGGARNAPPSVVYDFGAPVARLPAAVAWSGLALVVRAPAWFDSLNLDYRLAYDDPLVLREYAGSRWAGAPGVLLAQRLGQQLGVASGGGSTACMLRVELQEFAQRFASPQQSYGVLQADVSLFDARRQTLATRQFNVEQPAEHADAQGGAQALVAASNEFGRQLVAWLGAQQGKEIKGCRRQVLAP